MSLEQLDQFVHLWLGPLGWSGEAAARLFLAAILGGIIGLEREARGREAGFRTNLLVCVGSALVMLVSNAMSHMSWEPDGSYMISLDPGRIAYGVMTGIGFLGAGAIIKEGASVRGLTTAAGLWCIAAIGLTIGLGLYGLAAAATLLVLAALWVLNYLEDWMPRRRFRQITIRCTWAPECENGLTEMLKQAGLDITQRNFQLLEDERRVELQYTISYISVGRYDQLERELRGDHPYKLIASREL